MKKGEYVVTKENTRICYHCKIEKPHTEFYKSKGSLLGITYLCKACSKIKQIERKKKYPERVARTVRWSTLKSKYGLSEESYLQMLSSQDYSCQLCHEFMEEPHVDHDHLTGEVRGLLCTGCNTLLGRLENKDSKWFQQAIKYSMRIAQILANVEYLKEGDLKEIVDTPEGFKERYEARSRAKEVAKQLDLNPRKQIDKHLDATKHLRDVDTVTIVGKRP